MPLKYNEDTGIPRYEIPPAIELEEGVTPEPDVVKLGKRGVFAGDPHPGARSKKPVADEPVDEVAKMAKAAQLDALVATDEEVDAIEKLANEHSILHWPTLLRLINRLRKAEAR